MLKRQIHAVLILVSICLAGCGDHSAPRKSGVQQGKEEGAPVTIAVAKRIPLDRVLPILGTLYPKDEAVLSAEVEGKVEKTFVELGDRVHSDQTLAQIDTSAFEAYLHQGEANLARVTSMARNAESNLRRIQALSTERVAAASDLDQAQSAYDQAVAEVKSAEAGVAIAKLNLEKSHVRAPFECAIAERMANGGDFTKVGTPLFKIVNDNVLKLIAQAPERYASQVRQNQPITFTVDAWGKETFSGKVFLISPSINTSSRTFSLGALVDNPERRLKAGTFARGELVLERAVPTIMVPMESVIQASGVSRVFVVENNVAHLRTVETGRIQNGLQEILKGVQESDKVIITGHYRLVDGSKVRIRSETAVSADDVRGSIP